MRELLFQSLLKIAPIPGGMLVLCVLLVLFATFIEGFSVVSLLPIFILLFGSPPTGSQMDTLQKAVHIFFTSVNVPFTITSVAVFAGILFLLKCGVKLAVRWVISSLEARYEQVLMQSFLLAQLNAEYGYHERSDIGSISNVYSDEVLKISSMIGIIADLFAGALIACVFGSILILISPVLTVTVALSGLMLFFPLSIISHHGTVLGDDALQKRADLLAHIVEMWRGMHLIKSFGSGMRQYQRGLNTRINAFARSRRQFRFIGNSLSIWSEPLSALMIIAIIFVNEIYLHIPVPVFILFLVILARLIPLSSFTMARFGELLLLRSSLRTYLTAFTKASSAQERVDGHHVPVRPHTIAFSSVSFNYSDHFVLQDVSFRIEPNDFIFIIGPSASGKSTLVKLLLGYYTPTSGSIMIDGRRLSDLNLTSWRDQVSYIPQDAVLFSSTISDNIGIRSERISFEDIRSTARAVGLESLVNSLGNALHTPLDHQGIALSGGQKQRIALARALLPFPRICIFDEPFNALDQDSERSLISLLRTFHGKAMVLVVTHSTDWIEPNDKVLYFDDRQVCSLSGLEAASLMSSV